MSKNIFDISNIMPKADKEFFETLYSAQNILIERIVSQGQTTPENTWYDQERDEFVVLLQGKASLEFEGDNIIYLKAGEYIHIPAHCKHKVIHTTENPPCVWFAVHFLNEN